MNRVALASINLNSANSTPKKKWRSSKSCLNSPENCDRDRERGVDRGVDRGLDRGVDRGLDRGLDSKPLNKAKALSKALSNASPFHTNKPIGLLNVFNDNDGSDEKDTDNSGNGSVERGASSGNAFSGSVNSVGASGIDVSKSYDQASKPTDSIAERDFKFTGLKIDESNLNGSKFHESKLYESKFGEFNSKTNPPRSDSFNSENGYCPTSDNKSKTSVPSIDSITKKINSDRSIFENTFRSKINGTKSGLNNKTSDQISSRSATSQNVNLGLKRNNLFNANSQVSNFFNTIPMDLSLLSKRSNPNRNFNNRKSIDLRLVNNVSDDIDSSKKRPFSDVEKQTEIKNSSIGLSNSRSNYKKPTIDGFKNLSDLRSITKSFDESMKTGLTNPKTFSNDFKSKSFSTSSPTSYSVKKDSLPTPSKTRIVLSRRSPLRVGNSNIVYDKSIDLAVTKLKLKLQLAIFKLKQTKSSKTYKINSKTYLKNPKTDIVKNFRISPLKNISSRNVNLKNKKIVNNANYNLKLFQIKKNSSFYNQNTKKLPLVNLPPKPIHVNHLQLNNPFIQDSFRHDSDLKDQNNNPSIYLNPLLHNRSHNNSDLPSIDIILKTPIKNSKNFVNLQSKSLNLPRAQVVTDDTTIDEDNDQTILHDSFISSMKDDNKGRFFTSSPSHNHFATPNKFSVAKSLLQLGGYNYN